MRLDRAFAAFYRRCRAGEAPGFPRFRSSRRWDSLQWEDASGWRLDEQARRLYLLGVGHIRTRLHRPLRGVPKAITVRREGRRWFVSMRCVDVPAQPLPATGREVGIDVGIANVVTTSDGERLDNQRYGRRAANRLVGAQRLVATKVRGSGHRRRAVERVARVYRLVANQRRDFAHKASRWLVNDHGFIAVEDLQVTNMVRRPRVRLADDGSYEPNGAGAKAGLNRSIHDAGWGMLLRLLAYKAEDAGRELVAVRPHHSSQTCANCGHVDARNRVSQAEFRCLACGHEAHADVNAAINILRLGRSQRPRAA